MVKYLIAGAVLLLSGSAVGAGYTNITSIESLTVVRDEGVMLEGDFGNPGGCTYGNSLFISINHSQYSLILEVVMRAYFQGNPIFAYVLRCSDVGTPCQGKPIM